jgi:hypothetical protein
VAVHEKSAPLNAPVSHKRQLLLQIAATHACSLFNNSKTTLLRTRNTTNRPHNILSGKSIQCHTSPKQLFVLTQAAASIGPQANAGRKIKKKRKYRCMRATVRTSNPSLILKDKSR